MNPTDKKNMMEDGRVVADGHEHSNICISSLCRLMALSRSTFYHHIITKDAILEMVIKMVAEELISHVDKATQEFKSPANRLEAIFMAHRDILFNCPELAEIFFEEFRRKDVATLQSITLHYIYRYVERLHRLIDEGKACGEFDAACNTEAAAGLFIGMIHGQITASLLDGNGSCPQGNASLAFAIYRRAVRKTQ